jgi:hypothetical protein
MRISPFLTLACAKMSVSGISTSFPVLSQSFRQVIHALLTRPPLKLQFASFLVTSVRLACVKHAASVRPEPGSNSPSISVKSRFLALICLCSSLLLFRNYCSLSLSTLTSHVLFPSIHCLVFKDQGVDKTTTLINLTYHISPVKLMAQKNADNFDP